jgi:hypothetical protein
MPRAPLAPRSRSDRGRRALLPRARAALASACVLVASLAGPACSHTYLLEDRETPVEVVVDAPGAAQGPIEVPVLVYVGEKKAVDERLRFGPDRTRFAAPLVHVKAGEPDVSVVLYGRGVASTKAKVRKPSWVLVTLRGESATIQVLDRDPTAAR